MDAKTKQKISETKKGVRPSKETRAKMSETRLGMKYQPMSDEGRQNISEAKKGYKQTSEHIRNRFKWREGYSHSEETKRKIGEANRKENPKTDESKLWRKRRVYQEWRESVYKRDDWTCQKCDNRGGDLHPHHIRNFAEEEELRFEIDNGITFCRKCHRAFHCIYGVKNNNYAQVEEFIKDISCNY